MQCSEGEAKFWIEPEVELVKNWGLSEKKINELLDLIKERRDEIANAWEKHFRN